MCPYQSDDAALGLCKGRHEGVKTLLQADLLSAAVLSDFEPSRSNILGLWRLPLKQLPKYRAQWRFGACGEIAV